MAPATEEELVPLLTSLDDEEPAPPVSANDNLSDYLDRELANLPSDFDDVPPAPVVTNLDGTPAEPDPAPRPLTGNPKKTAAKPRASFARDRRNLHILNGFTPDVRVGRTSRPVPPSVGDTNPSHTSPPTPSRTTRKRRQADENDTRKTQPWTRTTEIAKGHAYVRTVSTRGAGLSWTLNLGGKVAQAANDNPEGLKEKLHDRLSKALKASPLGPRDFVFGIEATKAGRWHLHGVLDATPGERVHVEELLRKVGGSWDSAHHRDKQAHARTVVWGPDGWTRYLLKSSAATRRLLGTKSVLSVTRGCRQRAEELWEASRRDPQEPRQELHQRPAAPETPETAPAPSQPVSESRKPETSTTVWTTGTTTFQMMPPGPPALPWLIAGTSPLAAVRSRGPPRPKRRAIERG